MSLHMVLSPEAWARARVPALPPDYLVRPFHEDDRKPWIALMRAAGFEGWSHDHLRQALSMALPDGIFFIEHCPTRALVAIAMAGHRSTELHPFGGELGWVAVSPEHRGRHLSAIVSSEATKRFLSAGYREIYLATDDWRVAAIKTYLGLGYVPFLWASYMEERWRLVCRNIERRFEDLGAIRRSG